MNSGIICSSRKGAEAEVKKNLPTLNMLQEKGPDQGKEVGLKSSFSLRVIETTGKHVAC